MPNRPAIPAAIAREVLIESGHRCAVCGASCPLERAHIIPWHKSKEHKAKDLICLCANCHQRADLEKWGEKTLREYKRQYQAEDNQRVLAFLAEAVSRPQKQRYKVWDDDYDAKEVFTPEFLRQKMDYIHNNPLQPQWCLAERAEEYPWSSARFYLMDEPALIVLDDARRLMV